MERQLVVRLPERLPYVRHSARGHQGELLVDVGVYNRTERVVYLCGGCSCAPNHPLRE